MQLWLPAAEITMMKGFCDIYKWGNGFYSRVFKEWPEYIDKQWRDKWRDKWQNTQIYGRAAYDFRENSIVVTIPFKWINVMGDKLGNKPGNKFSELNDTQYRILSEIRNNPNVTKQQLASILNKSKTTVDNGIAVLREKRYIVRVRSNKTGYWKVLEPDEWNLTSTTMRYTTWKY